MNNSLKAITIFITTAVLLACGSEYTEPSQSKITTSQNNLITGISTDTQSTGFGQPASEQEIKVAAQKLGSYFNGQNANATSAQTETETTQSGDLGSTKALSIASPAKQIFRFYNHNTKAHFYTMSESERDWILQNFPFFSYEGSKFYAYSDTAATLKPVYRFYNKITATHFYTVDEAEKTTVMSNWVPAIFNYEGIAWYASTTGGADWEAVYRFFNHQTGTHFYTASASEKDHIIATWNWFRYEGVAYYVPKLASLPQPRIVDTGITSNQCFQTGNSVMVSCSSAAAVILNDQQDGMIGRDVSTPSDLDGTLGFSYSIVSNYPLTDCVYDNITGLTWEGKTTSGTRATNLTYGYTGYAPTDINTYIATVNGSKLCGYSDWRVPTFDELHDIVKYKNSDISSTQFIDSNWFPNTSKARYWTSSPYTGSFGNSNWSIDFSSGSPVIVTLNYATTHLRLVRGNSFNSVRYVISTNGQEVTDAKTGLIWRRCAEGMIYSAGICIGTPIKYSHDDAFFLSKSQLLLTGKNWRLPNVKEIASLVVRTRSNPSIDISVFPNTPSDFFWTSTPTATDSLGMSSVYIVGFGTGGIYTQNRFYGTTTMYLRLVRSGV